jgi:general secretion pathway protein K
MIVVVVLGVLTVLLTLVTNLTGEATFASQMMATIRAQDRAYYVAQSAVTAVLPLLPSSSDSAHTLQDPWAIGAPPLRIDDFMVSVKITDEERYINPNAMINPDGTLNDDQVKMFRRLLRNLGQKDEEITNAILDWMDADSTRRLPGGAEGQDYGERLPKNAPLDSVDEILDVKDIPSDLLSGPAATPSAGSSGLPADSSRTSGETGGEVKRGLRDYISVYGNGTVNINTAPPIVLQSLSDNLDQGLVNAIVERRQREPFKKMDDLLEVPGITRDHLYFIKKVADVKSATWRVEADVGSDNGTLQIEGPPDATLVAVYRGSGKGIKPLAWNLEEAGDTPEEGESPTASGSPTASPSPRASPSSSLGGRPGGASTATGLPQR